MTANDNSNMTPAEKRKAIARQFVVLFPFWVMFVVIVFMKFDISGETSALLMLSIPFGFFLCAVLGIYGGMVDDRPVRTEYHRGPLPHERDERARKTHL